MLDIGYYSLPVAGPTAQINTSGDAHVDQFIHGRAEGPIQMEIRAL